MSTSETPVARYGFVFGQSPSYRTRVMIVRSYAMARDMASDKRDMGYSTGRIYREGSGSYMDTIMAKHDDFGNHPA